MAQNFDFPNTQVPNIKLNAKTVYLILLGLFALWMLSGIYTVAPDEKAVILRFGKLQDVVEPGLHYHFPPPFENRITRSVTQVYREEIGFQTIDPGPPARYSKKPKESLMLTGDENIVDVEMVIQYRVSSIVKSLFSAAGLGVYERRGPSLVHDASEAVLRQVIGRHDIDEALTEGKLRIQTDIRDGLQILFDRYDCGLVVESVQLQTVGPPSQVDDAFKDVASAKEDRERLINEARGYQNDVIPKARGEAEKLIKEAEVSTAVPQRSTGINVLEDLLKKIVPILEDDYKQMTTSEEQRRSYRGHIVNGIQSLLAPEKVFDDTEGLAEQEIDVEIGDDGIIFMHYQLIKRREK